MKTFYPIPLKDADQKKINTFFVKIPNSIKNPIVIDDNRNTGVVKMVELHGGFNGIAEINGAFKPRMEMWIWDGIEKE